MLATTYLARLPVELLSRVYEGYTDKKVDPRIKMGISILVGFGLTGSAEMGWIEGFNNVQDQGDLFGPLIGALWSGGGALTLEYLFSEKGNKLKNDIGDKLGQLFTYINRPRVNPEMMQSDYEDGQSRRLALIESGELGEEG